MILFVMWSGPQAFLVLTFLLGDFNIDLIKDDIDEHAATFLDTLSSKKFDLFFRHTKLFTRKNLEI